MGKRTRNRYASSNLIENYRQEVKAKSQKAKNPEKYKRRKQIQKFSSDGKIDKQEGQKLAKKGVSLQKVENRNISDYRASGGASYEPLKIKRGAMQAERNGGGSRDKKKKKNRKVRSSSSSAPTTNYGAQADTALADIDQTLDGILNPAVESIDPITFQYAASSLVEPGNNLTIGAATDPSKTTGSDNFKRRGKKKKKNRLLKQIGKGASALGGFSATPASSAGAGASSAFGNV